MEDVNVLYQNIKARRQALNMSQQELAELVGYSGKSMISQVERGIIDLSVTMIKKFAEVLQTTPSALMGWEEDDGLIVNDLTDKPVPSQEEIDKAMNFFNRFQSLPPEKQTAFLTLLELPQDDV